MENAEFMDNWAIDAMAEHLEAVTYGQIKRLLINISPRCGKTNLTSICWPAWVWIQRNKTYLSGPQVRFLCGSYNDKLTLTNSNKVRRLIQSPFYQKHWGDRFNLMEDQNTKSQFDNTKGGTLRATSVRGTLLGVGGDVIIVDDPHNTEDAESEQERDNAETWWKELSSTRLNNPKLTPIVVNMQRLHTKDISGLILDSDEEFVHLMIPMRFEERRKCVTVILPRDQVDEYGNELPEEDQVIWSDPRTIPGELMWPERFDETSVNRIEKRLGPVMASGRLQQTPTPAGGSILKRDWWKGWDTEEAARYGLTWNENRGGIKEFPEFELIVASLDTAFGEKEENDYSALTVWGIWVDRNKNPRAMLAYAWQKRLPLHGEEVEQITGEAKVNFKQRQKQKWGLVEYVADTCKFYKVNKLLIENKSRGMDVANEIRRLYSREKWGIELVNPVKDKITRTHSIVPIFADGVVWAPAYSDRYMDWAEEVIKQCELFPKDEHDDLVDSVTQALKWLRDNSILVRADEVEAALEEEATYKPPRNTVAEQYGVV
jgi:predicted phage terminase large subunit-like protein